MTSVMPISMLNPGIPLMASGWLEPLIVGAILVLAAGWLIFRVVRFFQGRGYCGCGTSASCCPFLRISAAGPTPQQPKHTAPGTATVDPPRQA